jgi:hypothetical protein
MVKYQARKHEVKPQYHQKGIIHPKISRVPWLRDPKIK